MKKTYQPATVIVNIFGNSPCGESHELFVPEWTKAIAVDEDGKIHALRGNVWDDCSSWDCDGEWEEIADLETEVENWRQYHWELESFDCELRTQGVFEIEL